MEFTEDLGSCLLRGIDDREDDDEGEETAVAESNLESAVLPVLQEWFFWDGANKAASNIQRTLRWLGFFDYNRPCRNLRVLASVLLFCVAAIVLPVFVCVVVRCPDCLPSRQHPFQRLLQVSQSSMSALSFLSLLFLLRKNGLQELLLLQDVSLYDHICVRQGYLLKLRHAFNILLKILVPSFMVELAHSVYWFIYAHVYIGALDEDMIVKKVVMCCLWMVSWLYNNSVFLVMCLLFRLVCSLQVLRLQSYYKLLEGHGSPSSSVLVMLQEHMRLRQQLLLISHRFRLFLLLSLCAITLSHFAILFKVISSHNILNFAHTGDLMVCCAVQLVGFIICLHAASKITHMAQRIAAIVSQWHAIATCVDDLDEDDVSCNEHVAPEILAHLQGASHPLAVNLCPNMSFEAARPLVLIEAGDDDGDLNESLHLLGSTRNLLSSSHSFRKRHALVTYLQHCCAGISVYGFILDRGCLYTIFALELSIVLWTLGRTLI
ncbi:hypothetical protein KP509_06G062900 [Ceratopteris richardii]|uniref:Uncharacterized protein n=1 Tax=Ceratopteris richardii TaxID=49495 RepID=A0A8T2UPT7_CERRI|nr:hypothetical protein KP509_06G062900 [Ceratopteris richardii]